MDIRTAIVKILSANVLGSILSFAAIAFFAQKLGAAALAPFFLFQAAVGLIGLVSDIGILSAVEKRLSEHQHSGETLATGIVLKGLLLIPITIGVLTLRPQINGYLGAELALWLVISVATQQFGNLGLKVINGELRVGDTAIIKISQKVTWATLGTIFVELGHGVFGIVWAFVSSWCLVMLWTAIRSKTRPSRPTLPMARSLLSYGGYAAIGSAGGYVYGWLDVAILGFFVAQQEIGIYEVAWRVAGILMVFQGAVRTVIFPQISEWDASDDTQRIESLLEQALVLPLLFAIPALLGGILVGADALAIIYGAEFRTGYFVLIIFLTEKIFRMIHLTLSPTLFAINEPKFGYRGSIISIISNIILNITLIPMFGITGAAVATALSSIIGAGVNIGYLSRFITIKFPRTEVQWMVGSSIVMSAIVVAIEGVFTVSGPIHLIAIVLIGVTSYMLCVLGFPPIRSEVQKFIN